VISLNYCSKQVIQAKAGHRIKVIANQLLIVEFYNFLLLDTCLRGNDSGRARPLVVIPAVAGIQNIVKR
jgi:hypothetical protein